MQKQFKCTISQDPLSQSEVGASVSFELVKFGVDNSYIKNIPQTIDNWECFNASILAFALVSNHSVEIVGTAVIVAPGLAITATHNFIGEDKYIQSGEVVPYCFGIGSSNCHMWRVSSISAIEEDDMALLALVANSDLPDDNRYYQFGITTRMPTKNENLHILGFRFASVCGERQNMTFSGSLYISQGKVTEVYIGGRPFMPYLTIELNCGSVGAMSGGAVIDSKGLLVGIISRGLQTEEQDGPTYVSWLAPVLDRTIDISWPAGLYKTSVNPISIDSRVIFIEGKDSLEIIDNRIKNFKIWHE